MDKDRGQRATSEYSRSRDYHLCAATNVKEMLLWSQVGSQLFESAPEFFCQLACPLLKETIFSAYIDFLANQKRSNKRTM